MITIKLPTIIKLEEKNVKFLELTLKNYDALAKIDTIFMKNNAKVLFNIIQKENSQIKSFYVLLLNGSFENIVKEVKVINEVLSVNYGVKNVGNYFISPITIMINISFMDEKAVVIPNKSFIRSFSALRGRWGLASLVFLYHLGYNYGAILAKKFLENGLSNENVLVLSLEFLKQTGMFNDYDLTMFNPERGNVVLYIYGSVECSNSLRRKSSSHFLRGIIGGLISEIVGREVTVYETKCIARGDRFCEFIS